MRKIVFVLAVSLGACAADDHAVPGMQFARLDGSMETAWATARASGQVATTFPLVTFDIPEHTSVELLAGRSSNGPDYPATTGDDVVIADEHMLATATVHADGTVAFPELPVATGTWTSGSGTVPADLLCGVTIIAARAYATSEHARSLLASTWFVVVSPGC